MKKEDQRPQVLIVDDKTNMLRLMAKVLKDEATVQTANCGEDAIRILENHPIDVVVSDLSMPGISGLDVLKQCKKIRPRAEFILMTAYSSVPTAVEALRLGAYDYLTKPFDPEEAKAVILRALGRAAAVMPGTTAENPSGEVLPGLVARAPVMYELAETVRKVAASDATALLLGETGSGKEKIARALHQLSHRSSGRFVAVNCAAIPAELLESELFGFARGSFTGATTHRAGLFEEANKGTLFLDEIGEMRLSLQAKLTRAIEERAIRRLGDYAERQVDVRLIAATHRDLEAMVVSSSFREDLWYRLNVAAIMIPPLRDRREDIELLASYFLRDYPVTRGRVVSGFTAEAIAALEHFDWPGNVRQLRAAVERATVMCSGRRIDIGDLPPDVTAQAKPTEDDRYDASWSEAIQRARFDASRDYLEGVMRRFDGNVHQAAEHAGVERESFYRLMRRYGVAPDRKRT